MAADRIRVLPGSILSLPSPPPPPSQPPPQPVHLCKIAVIGDSSSGKTSVVDKFLLRKSCASPLHSNNHGGIISGTNGSVGGVQWCNASTTSQGTFGSAVGASLGPAAVEATLAEYSKKDIALKKKQQQQQLSKSSTTRQSPSMEEMTTTCVRAQVWDINVPQSAIITSQDGNNNYCNGSSISVNSTSSSSSIATSTPLQYNNNDNAISNLAPLLPLLKRINGIILTCQCPSPPSFTAQQQQQQHPNNNDLSYNSNMSIHSHNSNHNQSSSNLNSYNSAGNNNNSVEWQELDLLEVQIANWVNFISRYVVVNDTDAANVVGDGGTDRKESNNNNNKIYIMLTFADLAISQYSPNEWMRLSVKMEEICTKFEMVKCWRMGTCVTSVVDIGGDGESRSDCLSGGHDDDVGEATKQTRQQRQYGLFQRMAQQQQQMMEEMEDSVEALFIDMILMHLEGG